MLRSGLPYEDIVTEEDESWWHIWGGVVAVALGCAVIVAMVMAGVQ